MRLRKRLSRVRVKGHLPIVFADEAMSAHAGLALIAAPAPGVCRIHIHNDTKTWYNGAAGALTMSRHTWIVVMGVALLSSPASHADDAAITVIGVNPDLSEGAYALKLRNYNKGIRLTLEGLRSSMRPSDRVGALSNLCAGYVGIEDFESALRYCNQALRIDDGNWHAYNNRSLAYLGLEDTDAAQRDLERGLEINADARTLKEIERRIEAAREADSND